MKKVTQLLVLIALLTTTMYAKHKEKNQTFETKEDLGEALYSDTSLSQNRKMSCATCHHEKAAFVDIRKSPIRHMAALSADNTAIGDRNVPTASYAALIPDFHSIMEDGEKLYIGGQFLDGRAKDLKAQAKGPFLNPVEMQMPSKEAVIDRLLENDAYIKAFQALYDQDIFDDVDATYDALADAIALFEKTDFFSPFNSKYDKFLQGKGKLSKKELQGLALFSDTSRANCVACHPLLNENGEVGVFSDFTYDNLGVPTNTLLRSLNGKGSNFIDHGLLDNPEVTELSLDGAFRVSTLRNIAKTGPYMHNGVFRDLKTVVHFYNTRDVDGAINPETGNPWKTAEVLDTVNHDELGDLGLTDKEEDAIVAFMKTLTDKKVKKSKKEKKPKKSKK